MPVLSRRSMKTAWLALGLLALPLTLRAACPLEAAIGAWVRDWRELRPVRGIAPDMTMAEAVCTRESLVAELAKSHGRIVGYKAGLTNPAVRQRFNYAHPVRGTLLEKMLLPDGAQVPARFGARPVVEADLLVEIRDAAIHGARTHIEVLQSIARVIPFIELPDLVVAEGEPLTAPVIVAINAGARLGVAGTGIVPEATQAFADALAQMQVVTSDQSGTELARAPGSAILGHPLNAVMWLAADLAKSGVTLKPGDVLSLGAFSPPLPPRSGTAVTVRYHGLPGNPAVTVRFK